MANSNIEVDVKFDSQQMRQINDAIDAAKFEMQAKIAYIGGVAFLVGGLLGWFLGILQG